MRTFLLGVAVVVVGAAAGACSSDSPDSGDGSPAAASSPDVCADADALQGSLTALRQVPVVEEGTDGLRRAWQDVEDDWQQLADDAGDQYSDQLDALQADAETVREALGDAVTEPSAQALDAATAAVEAFVQSADDLADDINSTC